MKYFQLPETTPIVADGMVLYSDGSARPNPGFIGAGVHGYAYNNETPKKGTGLGTHSLSSTGYIDNKEIPKDKVQTVTPLLYYNVATSFDFQTSNNAAELLAAHVAIRLALASKVKHLLIKTDSEYVIKVLTKFAAVWVRNNWMKRDGTPVSNVDFIKDILVSVAEMQERGIKLDLKWVKGHADDIGNCAADKLANIGGQQSRKRKIEANVQEHPPEGYWKQVNDRHPFISLPRSYFTSHTENIPQGMYFVGNHDEDNFVGRAAVDDTLAVIHLKKSDEVLDTIVEHCKKLSPDTANFFFARLDSVFAKNRNKDILTYKEGALIQDVGAKNLNISSGDDVELVRHLLPVRLADRVFISLADMQARVQAHVAGNDLPRTVVNDVTPLFYETTRKVVKNVESTNFELLKKYIVGYRSEKITVKHEKGESEIILTFGIDVPDRNALKRMEGLGPTVKILTWMESDQCMRFACVIQTSAGDYGIWCGPHSNQVYIE